MLCGGFRSILPSFLATNSSLLAFPQNESPVLPFPLFLVTDHGLIPTIPEEGDDRATIAAGMTIDGFSMVASVSGRGGGGQSDERSVSSRASASSRGGASVSSRTMRASNAASSRSDSSSEGYFYYDDIYRP